MAADSLGYLRVEKAIEPTSCLAVGTTDAGLQWAAVEALRRQPNSKKAARVLVDLREKLFGSGSNADTFRVQMIETTLREYARRSEGDFRAATRDGRTMAGMVDTGRTPVYRRHAFHPFESPFPANSWAATHLSWTFASLWTRRLFGLLIRLPSNLHAQSVGVAHPNHPADDKWAVADDGLRSSPIATYPAAHGSFG